MELRSFCAFPAALVAFRPHDGQFAFAVVCKATYRLTPMTAVVSPQQEPIRRDETYFNGDAGQSVEHPNDLIPFKPRADVVLVGSAFVPLRRMARTLAVRMIVGELDKSLDIYGPRTLNADGTVREGSSWMSMPLRYERAAGGPDTWNPVGMSAARDAFGTRMLPQIMPKGFFLSDAGQTIPPAGFGPVSAKWPVCLEKLGARAGTFFEDSLANQVLGVDFDASFFQVAPRDQQIDTLRPDERIVLENLHPEHPRLVSNLPGLSPVAFVHMSGHAPTSIAMRADTLWIDTDQGICTLTFRGHVLVPSFDHPGTVFLLVQEPGQTLGWSDVESKLRSDERTEARDGEGVAAHPPDAAGARRASAYDPDTTTEINLHALNVGRPVMPFGTKAAAPERSRQFTGDDDEKSTAIYDVNALRAPRKDAAPSQAKAESTKVMSTSELLGTKPAIPFGQTPSNSPAPPSMAPLPNAPMPRSPGPTFGAQPPATTASSPAQAASGPAKPLPLGVLQRPPPPAFVGAAGASDLARNAPPPSFGNPPPAPRPIDSPPPRTIGEIQAKSMSAAGYDGVLAASNAAADVSSRDKPVPDKPPAKTAIQDKPEASAAEDSIELIWYDNAYVARMRKHPPWAALFRPPPKAAPPQRGQAPAAPPSAEAIEEATNADIFAVLSRAEPTREHDVVPGRKGVGQHEAALYLIAGTIAFPLDDIEMLKATSRAAAPLAASDKKLKEVLDLVEEVMKMPLEGAPEVVQGFIVRVREAWSNANRILPPDYLVTHTERTLLNQRHYQKRELLDDEWIRALYTSSPDAVPIPTYIPFKLAKRLPLFRQVSARLVVEALSQQDMYESHPIALRVVALARALVPQESASPARSRR